MQERFIAEMVASMLDVSRQPIEVVADPDALPGRSVTDHRQRLADIRYQVVDRTTRRLGYLIQHLAVRHKQDDLVSTDSRSARRRPTADVSYLRRGTADGRIAYVDANGATRSAGRSAPR